MTAQKPEESREFYRPRGFHPVHLGDVYNDRYEVLRKLGYGRYSTVWLVKDLSEGSYKALKILSAECYDGTHDIFELEILKYLRDCDPAHPGHKYIPLLLDSFKHLGPNGHHICLVLEPMGENLASFGTLFPKFQIPSNIMQRFTRQILFALDYAHKSRIIHTDIQPRNIMVKINDYSIIDNYLNEVPANPAAYDSGTDPWTIASQPLRDFYIREGDDMSTLNIALCDWGSASWTDRHLAPIIQPTLLRAPEVIIGAPWGPLVDIWNLGAVLVEVLDAVRLFNGRADQTGGEYCTKQHLEEMVALFGPFPRELLEKGQQDVVIKYFDEHGQIRDPIPRPPARLEDWIESMGKEDKEQFVSFVKLMMEINPDKRRSAEDLLSDPWPQL